MAPHSDEGTVASACTPHAVTIGPQASVVDAAKLMRQHHVGGLVVTRREAGNVEVPVGVLTDRDLVVGVLAMDVGRIGTLTAADVMSRSVVTVTDTDNIDAAIGKMGMHGIRRAPVVRADGSLMGMLSLDDLIDALAERTAGIARVVNYQRKRERLRF